MERLVVVDTIFYLPTICVLDLENSKNIVFSPRGRRNISIDVVQPVWASEHLKCHFRSNWPKCPWSTLAWLKVKRSENPPETTFFMLLHQTRATQRFLSTLTKFDPTLAPKAPKALILIRPSKWVWTNAIVNIIEFPFQRLFMGWN